MKTTLVHEADVVRAWHLVDAAGKPAGRLATKISSILRGKHKATYAPHVDGGDFVVVINAAQVHLSGAKEENKIYQDYSGYPGGLKEHTAAEVRAKHPDRIIRQAVKGMLPSNSMGRTVLSRLKIYAGSEHPHQAQNPQSIELL